MTDLEQTKSLTFSPIVLQRAVRNLLSERSPKRVIAHFKRMGYGPIRIRKMTGIDLKTLAAPPPIKKGVKPGVSREPAEKPLPPVNVLRNKYKAYEKHYEMYQEGIKAYHYLGHILTSKDFYETGARQSRQGTFADFDGWQSSENTRAIGDFTSLHGKFIRVRPDYVETRNDLPNFSINIGMTDGMLAADARAKCERIVATYFKGFKLPTKWTRAEETNAYGDVIKRIRLAGSNVESELSLEQLSSLKPKYEHTPGPRGTIEWTAPPHYSIPSDFRAKQFSGRVSLLLTLDVNNAQISNEGYASRNLEEGTLSTLGMGNTISIPVKVQLIIRWPIEFALFVTSAPNRKAFIPFMFFQYIAFHRTALRDSKMATRRSRKTGETKTSIKFTVNVPKRINHLGEIKNLIAQEKAAGRSPKARTNEDDMLVLGAATGSKTGQVTWIPAGEDKVDAYVEQIKASYDPEREVIVPSKINMKDTGLFTDWHNEKFAFVQNTGVGDVSRAADASGIEVYDLTGAVALDSTTINRDLNASLKEDKNTFEAFFGVMSKFLNGDYKAKPKIDYFSVETLSQNEILAGLATRLAKWENVLKVLLSDARADIQWRHLGGSMFEPNEKDDHQEVRALLDILSTVTKDMAAQFDDIDCAYRHKIDFLRYRLLLCTKYARDETKHREAAEARLRTNTAEGVDVKNPKTVRLVNMPNVTMLMPHQMETNNVLRDHPENVLVDISTGGGKTLIGIADAMNLIYDKAIKRALIVVPNNLVRSWINEVNEFTKGQVNVIAITLHTLRAIQRIVAISKDENVDWNATIKPDYDMLRKMIESAPPNTLFVTTFHFLRCDNEDVVYGMRDIKRLYAAENLRDIGFDGVFVDESHFSKNLGTAQTKGVSIVATGAKYVRLMSGTLINNTLSDIVGQMGISQPAALGTKQEFEEKYSEGGGKMWRYGASDMISAEIAPYTSRITHKKQRWAFVLPQLVEDFSKCHFTEAQAKFYDAQLKQAMDDLEKDPKFKAMFEAGGESDEKALQAILDSKLHELEEFTYAPDTVEAFASLPGLSREDLISPKVEAVEQLLEMHFKGHDLRDPDLAKKGVYKVIIFSSRKVASLHCFEHLSPKWKKAAVHYSAGNIKAFEMFMNSPYKQILVADELSINTGQNMQLASRMIRLETLWTPGNQEQAIARIWRPDTKNLSGRPEVYMNWLYIEGSLEVAKIGRLVSKQTEKMKFDRAYDSRFNKEPFDAAANMAQSTYDTVTRYIPNIARDDIPASDMLLSLPLISMNHASLKAFRYEADIMEYLSNYAVMNAYEESEFRRGKESGEQQWVILEPENHAVLEGSKPLAYMPRAPGMKPELTDPENKYGFKAISVIKLTEEIAANIAAEANEENEDDDDEEDDAPKKRRRRSSDEDEDPENEEQEQQVFDVVDTIVDTEFGRGLVVQEYPTFIWVDIPGLPRLVKIPKTTAWAITNEDEHARAMKAWIKANDSGTSMLRNPGQVATADSIRRAEKERAREKAPPSPQEEIKRREAELRSPKGGGAGAEKRPGAVKITDRLGTKIDTAADNELEVYGEIIDGQIGLTCMAEDADSSLVTNKFGFMHVPEYYAIRIKHPDALDKYLAVLTKAGLTVRKDLVANIRPYIDMLRTKRLDVHDPSQFSQAQRFFAIESHRMAKDDEIRPYPLVWGGKLFLAVDKLRTPAARKYLRAITKAIANGNLIANRDVWLPKEPLQSGTHIRLFRDKQQAIVLLTKLAEKIVIPNFEETLKYLAALKSAKMLKKDVIEEEESDAPVRTRRVKADPAPAAKRNAPKPAPRTTQVRTTKPAAPTPTARKAAAPPPKRTAPKPTPKPAPKIAPKRPAAKPAPKPPARGGKKVTRF